MGFELGQREVLEVVQRVREGSGGELEKSD